MGINRKDLMSTLILTGFWNRFLTGSGSETGFLWIVSFNSTNMGINGKGLMSTLILTGFWNRFLTEFFMNCYFYSTNMGINGKVLMSTIILTGF